MTLEKASLDQVLRLAKKLTPLEKVQLIEGIVPDLEAPLEAANILQKSNGPLQSVYGLCADLGPAPSAEEIDEVRREAFKNFPGEDL